MKNPLILTRMSSAIPIDSGEINWLAVGTLMLGRSLHARVCQKLTWASH
jgi:hypothetical protein